MSIKIESKINLFFNANTYIIKSISNEKECYLIDIGNATDILNDLAHGQYIKGIFLTHAHYDHICGINQIIDEFPNCTVFCSEYTKKALADSKINLSFYHQTPITYNGNNIEVINEKESINLFHAINIEVIETPGHNEGSLTFKIEDSIFTGDSLIPGTPVVTKLKSGNKTQALSSIIKIRNSIAKNATVYPGHGASILVDEIDWDFYL